jgi:hypothetical protein
MTTSFIGQPILQKGVYIYESLLHCFLPFAEEKAGSNLMLVEVCFLVPYIVLKYLGLFLYVQGIYLLLWFL